MVAVAMRRDDDLAVDRAALGAGIEAVLGATTVEVRKRRKGREGMEDIRPLIRTIALLDEHVSREVLHEVDGDFARAQTTADWLVDAKSGQGYHPGVTVAVAEGFGQVSSYGGYWLMRRVGDARVAQMVEAVEQMEPGDVVEIANAPSIFNTFRAFCASSTNGI